MGTLGLRADPEGWLNAGYSLRVLMDTLDGELYDADGIGGAGLAAHWTGPVADAFHGNLSGLRSCAEDLIAHGRRAAAAIIDFGGRLEDFVKRAADLEGYWLDYGLRLEVGGMQFALPWGFEHLPPEHQVSFHQLLAESDRAVTAMWSDIRAAVGDVVTVLESLIAAFEDFAVLRLGTVAWFMGGDLDGYHENWVSAVSDGLTVAVEGLGWARNHTPAKIALRTATVAGKLDRFVKATAPEFYIASVGWTAWQTYDSAVNKKRGWLNGIEDNAGSWAGLAAGAAVLVLMPVSAPALGVVLLGGVAAFGVGKVVQWWVDDNRASINQGFTDIGHGGQIAAKAVGHEAAAAAHGVEDAGEWGVKRVEGLAKYL